MKNLFILFTLVILFIGCGKFQQSALISKEVHWEKIEDYYSEGKYCLLDTLFQQYNLGLKERDIAWQKSKLLEVAVLLELEEWEQSKLILNSLVIRTIN